MNWDFEFRDTQSSSRMWSNKTLKITDIKMGMYGNPWGVPIGHVRARVHISGCTAGELVTICSAIKGKSVLVNYDSTELLHTRNSKIGVGGESVLMQKLKGNIPSPRYLPDSDFWGCDSWHVV